MRWSAGLFVFFATPAFAGAPLCALPGPAPMKAAATVQISMATTVPSDGDRGLPPTLSQIAFVQHVASAGAQVRDLGTIHGLQAIAAKSGSQFMLFELSQDGQAGVSGVPIDLSVSQLQSVAAGNVTDVVSDVSAHWTEKVD